LTSFTESGSSKVIDIKLNQGGQKKTFNIDGKTLIYSDGPVKSGKSPGKGTKSSVAELSRVWNSITGLKGGRPTFPVTVETATGGKTATSICFYVVIPPRSSSLPKKK
jgi:hypothetical protein